MGVIISAPYIDLGQIINASKPTARVDGSALVVGDRWVNSATGEQWFWNGTYWLSHVMTNVLRPSGITDNANLTIPLIPSRQLFLRNVVFGASIPPTSLDASNFWTITFATTFSGDWTSQVSTSVVYNNSSQAINNRPFLINANLNFATSLGSLSQYPDTYRISFVKTGNPSSISVWSMYALYYHFIG